MKNKIIIDINKNMIVILIGIILVFSSMLFVYAYNPNYVTTPKTSTGISTFGHSPDEIMVSVNGVQKSLQAAINNNDFKRPSIVPCSTNQIRVGGNCVSLPTTSCFSNQVLTYSSGSFKCILNTA